MAAARSVPPFGWCHNPLLLRFYHDPDAWTLSLDEGDTLGPDDAGAFVSDDDSPPPPFIRAHQLTSPPLSDLADFGRDRETGSTVIPLDVTLRFFGRTLSGDDIASAPASFTIEVVP